MSIIDNLRKHSTHAPVRVSFILTGALGVLVWGCSDSPGEQNIIKKPEPLEISLPSNFPDPVYRLENNPPTKGRRNSLPIQNLLFYKTFFWDGGMHNLDFVPLNAIGNEVEMDEEVDNILAKLENDAKYKSMFASAYGSEEITSTKFLQALSQFSLTFEISWQNSY